MRRFVEGHWGDLIGLLFLYTSLALVLWGSCQPSLQSATRLGESLVLAAMGVLKLRGAAPGNEQSPSLGREDHRP